MLPNTPNTNSSTDKWLALVYQELRRLNEALGAGQVPVPGVRIPTCERCGRQFADMRGLAQHRRHCREGG